MQNGSAAILFAAVDVRVRFQKTTNTGYDFAGSFFPGPGAFGLGVGVVVGVVVNVVVSVVVSVVVGVVVGVVV